jgi:hypothetical protein
VTEVRFGGVARPVARRERTKNSFRLRGAALEQHGCGIHAL